MPEERKLATVLFADIVGSTAMGSSHDPEIVRRSLSRAFIEMRTAVESHGGIVEKFVGDAVMAVFGIPDAHDDDADRAVRAAFALHERIAALTASGRLPLELRIGVNTGPVVAGGEGTETLVTGSPVNEAARLQQAASAGEILAGALTRRLTMAGVRYGASRRLHAKGIGELEAYPAEALASTLPEQHRGIEGLRAPLIGRDDELRLLVDSYRKATSERRAYLLTVFGSAGVGKSRLVAEFVDTIGAGRVRRGRCLPYGEGITYWPVVEMLRADAGISPMDSHADASAKLRSAVFAAFGEASEDADAVARRLAVVTGIAKAEETLADIRPDSLQHELRWGVRRHLERRAEAEPLVVVFDDIHWAEATLLDLIEHVAEWSRAPLFLICLARPELRDRRAGWGGGLMNAGAVILEPLTSEESARLVAELLDIDALPDAVRAQVIARADGNPLYLEEFLRMLIDNGHIGRRAGRWVATGAAGTLVVPPTLHGLIAARLDQSPPDVKRMLQRAAVVGKVFWRDALVAQGGPDDDLVERLDGLLSAATRRDLIEELDERGLGGGRAYAFRHILVRDVAYEAVPKEQRARSHDAFGRWLENAAGDRVDEYADIVVHHAEQAFAFADELGEEAAPELGQRALRLLLAAGRAAWQRKDLLAVRSFYARAARVAERVGASAEDRAEAVTYAAYGRAVTETTAEAVAGLRQAIGLARAARPGAGLVHGLLMLSYFTVSTADAGWEEAIALLDEALGAARATGEPELVATALYWRSFPYWWKGDLASHRRQNEEALAYAREHGVRSALPEILLELVGNAGVGAEHTRADELHGQFAAVAERSASLLDRRLLKLADVKRSRIGDRLEDAVRAARELIALSERIGDRELVARAHDELGDVLFVAGDAAGSRDAVLEALRRCDPSMRGALPEMHWKLSRAYLALGDLENAREQAEAGRASVIATDVYSVATTTAGMARVRAAEGRHDEADTLFREAIATLRGTGYRYMTGELERDHAEQLIARGRIGEARAFLLSALATASDPLAIGPRRRIEELLRRADEAVVPGR